MKEQLLQYVWRNQLFDTENLKTTLGEPIKVLNVGQWNSDSGPDFFNSKIEVGQTTWAGNIEIHLKSSDWFKHKHHLDKAYDNVILHVVLEDDSQVTRSNGTAIAALEILPDEKLEKSYNELMNSVDWVACEKRFHLLDPFFFKMSLNRLMVERLEKRMDEVQALLEQTKNNWNEAFYRALARNFGFKVNAEPFELLAKATPLKVLAKHKNNLFQLECLLFGQAGFLNSELIGDDYFLRLRKEFQFLYQKYKLKPIENHLWKFLRLRPGNFPTIRIAQFAALIHQSNALFSQIIEVEKIAELRKLFRVNASDYWETHYRFNKETKQQNKRVGNRAIDGILINTVVPFLFAYGELQSKQEMKDRELGFLESLPAEENAIVKKWSQLGMKSENALESQALLQLKHYYCEHKKCLDCQVGRRVLGAEK
ncbi:DUF2851 family protein [Prolixibacteraceae bacterium JC049]|nr:DUF2851 family protein [Prolixibacteraceae bacterium JC049]